MSIDLTQTTADLERRLDDLEASLPPIPAKALSLGRATAHRIASTASDVVSTFGDAASDISRRLATLSGDVNSAVATTVGQTRSAADRTATTVQRNTREAVGQARAQAGRSVDSAERAATALLDDASRAVEPDENRPAALERWTKEDLYERAQELDIDGRSAMNKTQLVKAIRAAN